MGEMTRMIKKVAAHIRRYNPYSVYAAKSELKGEVGASYLTWMWWILDPVLFMFVYVFITVVVFKSQGEYLPVVVIIGLTVWNFFNKTVMVSVKIVNTFRGIVSKIYIPKYMLILEKLYVNFFKMTISFGIVVGFAVAYRLRPTIHLLECILLVLLLVLLRFLFYLSGVFYDVSERLSQTVMWGLNVGRLMVTVNPIAYVIDEFRKVIIYGQAVRVDLYLYWLVVSGALLYLGLKLMYRFENSYIKVV